MWSDILPSLCECSQLQQYYNQPTEKIITQHLSKVPTALSKSQYSTKTSCYQHNFPQTKDFSMGGTSQHHGSNQLQWLLEISFLQEVQLWDSSPYGITSWRELRIWVMLYKKKKIKIWWELLSNTISFRLQSQNLPIKGFWFWVLSVWGLV